MRTKVGVGAAAAAGALATLLSAGAAFATPSAKLVYVRSAGAESCPSEPELRKAVAARLGYDPFFVFAQKTVIAQLTRDAGVFRARVQIVGEDGNLRGERALATAGDDCVELAFAIALAVSLAIDDITDTHPPPPPESSAPVARLPEPAVPLRADADEPRAGAPRAEAPPSAASPRPDRLTARFSAGPAITLATAPAPAVAGALAGSVRWRSISLRLDGRADLPASTGLGATGRVATNTTLTTIAGCLHGALVFGCGGLGGGLVFSHTAGIAHPADDHAAIAVGVGRVGLELAIGGAFYLEPSLEVGLNLARRRVVVDTTSVYEMAPAWGSAGFHLGTKFL